MKLLSANQFQQWDAYTISHEPISAIELMERASSICVEFIIKYLNKEKNIKIFCGKGNNGGDGLAIARLLVGRGLKVAVYILESGKIGSNNFQTNLHRLQRFTKEIYFIQSEEMFPVLHQNDMIIDALYGTGLNAALNELPKLLVDRINSFGAEIISIDLPSGLFLDRSSKNNTIIKAKTTLTFQSLKLCFLAAENEAYFGNVQVLNIELQKDFLKHIETTYTLLEKEKITTLLRTRSAFSHKGKFGHACLIAGGPGKMGAAIISAKACMRSGVGMLTLAVPENEERSVYIGIPEAMVINRDAVGVDWTKYAAIGIGPGLGTDTSIKELILTVLKTFKNPIVLDADALNLIAVNQDLLKYIGPGSILTPHPKEFDRLFGSSENEFERWQKAIDMSKKYQLVILVKGHYTLIADKGYAIFNSSGNAGLAKAGSGDTLTGVITALLSQGYTSGVAAILGVYLHGLAADLALEHQSVESLLATDVIDSIGKAFKKLHNPINQPTHGSEK